MYLYAWSLGLKTTYYLRTLAVTSVEKSTLDLVKQQNVAATLTPTQPAIVQPYLEPKLEPQIQPLTTPLMATSAVAVNTATVAAQEETVTKLMLCKIDDPDCEACQ